MNRLLTVLLLVSVLSATEAFGQIKDRVAKPRPKPPTTTTTTKPKPTKPKPTKPRGVAPTLGTAANRQKPLEYETITANGVSFRMVRVEGGTFTMGATSEQGSDAYDWEKPAHQVTLSSFSIGETEVTQELWQAVMGSNPSRFKGSRRPVEKVSWEDCQDFIRRLNDLTGKNFRLPTEAEWEYAARGGNRSNGYKYAGGSSIDDVAWYDKNSEDMGSSSPDYGTHNVGTKRANELGLYDMAGNVWEWCQDWYGSYSSGSQTNPRGASSGSSGVHRRGGGWDLSARDCRVSRRDYTAPTKRFNDLGMRLAL